MLNKAVQYKIQIFDHFLATSAAVFSRLSLLLISFINIQFMNPEEFGICVLLMFIANMVSAFVSCGGDLWLNRFSRYRHSLKKQIPLVSNFYLKASFTLASAVSILAICLGFFGDTSFKKALCFALLWAGCMGLLETHLAILRTTNEIRRFFVVRDFITPFTLILSIFIFKINTADHFFMTAFVIWLTTLLVVFEQSVRKEFLKSSFKKTIKWSRWKKLRQGLIKYTALLIINNLVARLANGVDTLILAKVLPVQWVGRYRFSAHFSNAFTVVQHFVFLALPWQLRGTHKEDTSLKTVQFRQQLLVVSSIIALILLMILIEPILTSFKELDPVRPMVNLFKIFLMIRFGEILWGPQHEILISNNKVKWDTLANGAGLIATLLGFGVSFYFYEAITSGVIGAALGSITGQWVRFQLLKKLSSSQNFSAQTGLPWISMTVTVLSVCWYVGVTA